MSDSQSLVQRHCEPCEGGVTPLDRDQSVAMLEQVPGWQLSDDGMAIFRKLALKNFVRCLELLNKIGEVSEAEQHHPDLHLTGYRNLRIEVTTHAIGGLSENDFILAAKINELMQP